MIRVAGGDLREVRSSVNDTLLWRGPTGGVRVTAYSETDHGEMPAGSAIIRLTGSPYGAVSDVFGHLRFESMVPGVYLFEASTPTLDALGAEPGRVEVTVRPDESNEARVALKPLPLAAAEVCKVRSLDRDAGVLVGLVSHDSIGVGRVHVHLEWPGNERDAETNEDGFYRVCNVPTQTLILLRASRGELMRTVSVTLPHGTLVRQRDIVLEP